jgi:hypothetical protein
MAGLLEALCPGKRCPQVCTSVSLPAGVMMWECYHSTAPYRVQGDRLTRRRGFPRYPKDCPLSYAVLATSCLAADPSDRPNFWQICGVLEDLSQHLKGHSCQETATAHVTLLELEQLERDRLGSEATPSPTVQTRAASAIGQILSRVESQAALSSLPGGLPSSSEVRPPVRVFLPLPHSLPHRRLSHRATLARSG